MVDVPPWPVLVTLGAGVANLVLVRYLWPYRDEPGGRWFLVVIAIQVFWCLTYGVALLVFDPTLRRTLELLTWIPVNWIGVFFLGFALTYTGRVDLVHSPGFYAAVAFEILSTALILTNPWHHFVWSDFAVAPVFGAATVTYTHHAWVFVQYFGVFALGAVGTFVLLDTVVSYGPLFRKQAIALALTPIPPAIAFTAWAFELGPYPLNLTAAMFLPHVLLDMYALFGSTMFEFKPATRRTGERAAIDDIGTAVAMVDRQSRVITLNAAAEDLFGVSKRAALTDPLDSLYGGDDVDLAGGEQAVTLQLGGRRREFNVAVTPLVDPAETHVGYTVVFQDVTAERQRKQRLEVLNRILRHNLRNDLSVVINYADLIESKADGDIADYADRIESQSQGLVGLGEKARQATQALDGELTYEEIAVADLLGAVAEDCREAHDGTVTVDAPEGLTVESDREVLALVVESLVENGLAHGGADPTVEIAADGTVDEGSVLLTVRDDGPGIPEHELSVLDAGEESALEHGSGMGLWAVVWGMTALGGNVSFERPADGGTVARVRVPGLVDDRTP